MVNDFAFLILSMNIASCYICKKCYNLLICITSYKNGYEKLCNFLSPFFLLLRQFNEVALKMWIC